ncbi:MAG: hypothetical protein P1U77_11725 [Rubripirellula sp.]|nr:hypothetical protein [Planctomycetaceae bacterium]MDF1842095.1 hypothetical protein [Rubripirellula sp.]
MNTIEIVHKEGFPDIAIGFELCHGKKHTILAVKTLVVRELEQALSRRGDRQGGKTRG